MISLIIPARNESKTIEHVVYTALNCFLVDEVIVVDNNSIDETGERAKNIGATVIFESNIGKGQALKSGANIAKGEILVFIDGDLINFTENHIADLISPIINGECHMSCCLFDRGKLMNFIHINFLPIWTGQRAIHKEIFSCLSISEISGYKVESALNTLCFIKNLRVNKFIGKSLKHVSKEKKHNFILGICSRLIMYIEAFYGYLYVYFNRLIFNRN